jgi:hypothetical protein
MFSICIIYFWYMITAIMRQATCLKDEVLKFQSVLRNKSKTGWCVRVESTRGLLSRWSNTIKIQLSMLVQYKVDTVIISSIQLVLVGECPSNSPFLKNNGAEEWRDTRTFSNLNSTHCALLILLIINLVTIKSLCILVSKVIVN